MVYVNGHQAFDSNLSADPFDYLTRADGAIGGAAESTFYEYAVDPVFLVDGTNVLAVEIHQANPTSSDISFDLELVATVQFTRPTPTDDGYSTDRNTTLNVDAAAGLLANDVDPKPGPQPLTAVLVDDVEHGQLALQDDGSFQYIPAPGYTGADSFTYRAHDGQWYSNLATVDLTVINNDTTAPTADIADVSPDPINSAVAEIGIVFTEWVDGLELGDLALTHDGGPDLLTAAQTLTTTDNVTWTLGNLAGLTAADGDYALTLAAAGAGIVDGAGNALADDATETWAMDATAPTVEAVLVNATAWGQSFLDELGQAGYAVPAGADQLDELPWSNLDQVIVVFSEETTVEQEDLVLYGVAVPEYAVTGFGYDQDTLTATWTFAAAAQADKLLVSLGDGVTDPAGNALDGEWVDTVSTYSSGDGSAGGDFRFRLNILPGDADQSGEVRSSDVIKVRRKGNTAPGDAEYSIFYDVDGSGEIRSSDVIKVRRLGNTQLPDGEPTMPPAAAAAGGVLDAQLIAAAVDAAQREADSEASQSDTDPLDVLLLSQIVPLTL